MLPQIRTLEPPGDRGRGGVVGRCLGCEVEASWGGISAFEKETPRASGPSAWEGYRAKMREEAWDQGEAPPGHAGTLVCLLASRLQETHLCCLQATRAAVFCYSS